MARKKDYNKIAKKELHYNRLYNKYKLLALNIFSWGNLPNNIKSRHIELALFNNGQCLFYDDENLGLICLPCHGTGKLNPYGEHVKYSVNGVSFNKIVDLENGVLIKNNDLSLPTNTIVVDYAERMQIIEESINANIKQQKFPYFIKTNKDNELTIKNLYKKFDDNEPVIFGGKNIDENIINVFNTNAPYIADKLNYLKYELEREILTTFGLNNNYEKKERLLTDEVNSNNDYIFANVRLMYLSRLQALKEINEKFNLDVKLNLNHNIKEDEETEVII